MADMIHPSHPLMHASTDLVLEAHRSKLKQGSVLVDPNDDGLAAKVLFMVDHTVREAKILPGSHRVGCSSWKSMKKERQSMQAGLSPRFAAYR